MVGKKPVAQMNEDELMDEYNDWYERVRNAVITRKTKSGVGYDKSDISLMPWLKAQDNIMTWALDYLPNKDTTVGDIAGKQKRGFDTVGKMHGIKHVQTYHTHFINGKRYSHPIIQMHTRSDPQTSREHAGLVRIYMKNVLFSPSYQQLGIKKGTMYGFSFKVKDGKVNIRKPMRRKSMRKPRRKDEQRAEG